MTWNSAILHYCCLLCGTEAVHFLQQPRQKLLDQPKLNVLEAVLFFKYQQIQLLV
jgi:hypothetical protein